MNKILITTIILYLQSVCLYAQSWIELGSSNNPLITGIGIDIKSIAVDNAGNVYAGGEFQASNGFDVAKWNGASWSFLGVGISTSSSITAVAVDNSGNVYAGGNFTDNNGKNYISKWNGTAWSELGPSTTPFNANSVIFSIVTDNTGNVYAAGTFFNANGYYVAKWNGTTWSELGSGSNSLKANGRIHSVAVDNAGNVYASGEFTNGYNNANGRYYVAKWNGTTWSELGSGSNALNANNWINTVKVDNSGNVYAGGLFTDINSIQYVAKWDGNSWSALGSSSSTLKSSNYIESIVIDNVGNIYVGGLFGYVAKWDGTIWSKLGGSSNSIIISGSIYSLAIDGSNNLYSTGSFTDTNGIPFVAKWIANSTTTNITDQLNMVNVQVYPNPNSGLFTLSGISNEKIFTVSDLTGKEIFTTELANEETLFLDLSNIKKGIYVYKAIDANNIVKLGKIVIQ